MPDLTGYIDPHVHAAPEHLPRLLDDIELAQQARDAGMTGVLLKSHTTLTADRAAIAAKVVPGVRVWGGLVLNQSVGGLNPAAVETALAYGAAEVWMPTIDATNHRIAHGGSGGVSVVDRNGDLAPEVFAVLELLAESDTILGTGHLCTSEILLVVRAARECGVRKILITHPEAPFVDMPLSTQAELAALGCYFERTWVFTTPALGQLLQPEQLMHQIASIGYESTVLATDMGQVNNPTPVQGLGSYVQACIDHGFTGEQIRRMAQTNIAQWLP